MEVSTSSVSFYAHQYDAALMCVPLANFALTGTGYAVVAPLQSFNTIKLPRKESVELAGVENKQRH
jgi:hypothetical protein